MKSTALKLLVTATLLTACQSNSDTLGISELTNSNRPQPASIPVQQAEFSAASSTAVSTSNPPESALGLTTASLSGAAPDNYGSTASFIDPMVIEPVRPRIQKTYLINGLVSAVPFIGYGLTNLSRKLEGAKLYSYMTPVEGSVAVAPAVLRDITKAHSLDPDVEVNLIGISYGANLITQIASRLDKKGIRVNYLGIIEGTTLRHIPSNVRVADNFTCTYLDCTRATARLARGNSTTRLNSYKFKTSHIPMGNNAKMHTRILQQVSAL